MFGIQWPWTSTKPVRAETDKASSTDPLPSAKPSSAPTKPAGGTGFSNATLDETARAAERGQRATAVLRTVNSTQESLATQKFETQARFMRLNEWFSDSSTHPQGSAVMTFMYETARRRMMLDFSLRLTHDVAISTHFGLVSIKDLNSGDWECMRPTSSALTEDVEQRVSESLDKVISAIADFQRGKASALDPYKIHLEDWESLYM